VGDGVMLGEGVKVALATVSPLRGVLVGGRVGALSCAKPVPRLNPISPMTIITVNTAITRRIDYFP
jgi:hypothetical protein